MDKDFMLTYYDKMVRPIWTEPMKTPRYQRAAGEHDKIEREFRRLLDEKLGRKYTYSEIYLTLQDGVDALQLVAVPVIAIIEAAVVSVAACLLATAIPLHSIAKMNIVETIENIE